MSFIQHYSTNYQSIQSLQDKLMITYYNKSYNNLNEDRRCQQLFNEIQKFLTQKLQNEVNDNSDTSKPDINQINKKNNRIVEEEINEKKLIQCQQQSQQQSQLTAKERQIQYYIYEDLSNFLEAVNEYIEVINYFGEKSTNPYIQVAENKLITQNNLSNMIHRDNDITYIGDQFMKIQKMYALQIYKQLQPQTQNQKLQEVLRSYEKNFEAVVSFQQIQPVPTKIKGQFNQKNVQNVMAAMNNVQDQLNQIQQGTYQTLEQKQIQKKIEQRKRMVKEQLKSNFPDKTNQQQKYGDTQMRKSYN